MADLRPGRAPAELEELLRQFRRWRGRIFYVLIAVVVLIVLSSLLYQIEADSRGVLLRFGQYRSTTFPGLHLKLPWPIDTVAAVPVEKIQTLEFGFATLRAGKETRYASKTPEHQQVTRMLTGDLNIAEVEWILQYRINDPRKYLFTVAGERRARQVVDIDDLIRDCSESVMRRIVGDASVDEVITSGREQIAADAKRETQDLLDQIDCGVEVVAVKLQDATPPEQVKDAFDAVERAKQKKEQLINQARGERNRQVPAARGQRDRAIIEAEGYRERVVREARGRANAFLARLTEYEKAPEVTRARLYLEAMEEVLAQIDDLVIIDESVRGVLPLLDLGGEPRGAAGKEVRR